MGKRVGYLKPVGQRFESIGDRFVDQDVCLMKEFFRLNHALHMMNPVVIPPGYTRDFVDGKIDAQNQITAIHNGFEVTRGRRTHMHMHTHMHTRPCTHAHTHTHTRMHST